MVLRDRLKAEAKTQNIYIAQLGTVYLKLKMMQNDVKAEERRNHLC